MTVRYVYVPAIVLVYALMVARARRLRSADTAIAAAALGVGSALARGSRGACATSAPIRWWPPAPGSRRSAPGRTTWRRAWLGLMTSSSGRIHRAACPTGEALFGWACLLAAAAAFLWTLWRWRTAERVDLVLVVAIAANLGVYAVSTIALRPTPQELTGIPVLGAVLVARALMPASISRRQRWGRSPRPVFAAALVPLCLVATQPAAVPVPAVAEHLGLQAHGLRQGLAMYVGRAPSHPPDQRRGTAPGGDRGRREDKPLRMGNAEFLVQPGRALRELRGLPAQLFPCSPARPSASSASQPASGYVGGWAILIYHKNLIEQVSPVVLPATQ